MNTLRRADQERGFILLWVYLLVGLIAIFSTVLYFRSRAFSLANERSLNKTIAFSMAESGVDWALKQLASNSAYTGTPSYVPMDTDRFRGGFTVTVTNVPNDLLVRKIDSTGYAPDNNSESRAHQTSTVTAYGRYQTTRLFDYGIFAENSITLTSSGRNASVDSYNSSNGPYGGANVGNEGDIATNGTSAGAITVTGNTVINGDAFIGPSGDPSTGITVGPNATVTGTRSATMAPVEHPLPSTEIPSSGALDISSGTQVLMPGAYRYSSLTISGQGQLSAAGPVTIYVDGNVNLSGQGVVSTGNLPKNLQIFVTGTGSVSISGQGQIYAAIYAPRSIVTNEGNGGVFGAVVAGSYVQTGNGSIHFDEALRDLSGNPGSGIIRLISWQEQNSLTWGTGHEN